MLNLVQDEMLALFVATSIPIAAFLVVARLGRCRPSVMGVALLGFAWGVTSTWWVAGPQQAWLDARGFRSLIVTGGPLIEEIAKAGIVPVLLLLRRSSWYIDGIVVGLATGTGFAVRENAVYLGQSPGMAVEIAFARVTSTNLMHAACSALVGAVLATPVLVRRGRIALTLPMVIGLAFVLHSIFNRFTFESNAATTTTLVGVGVFGVASLLVFLGDAVARRSARSELLEHGIAQGEVDLLDRRSRTESLLDEMSARFGHAAADAARSFIEVQREIGMATWPGTTPDPDRLDVLRKSADAVRREIGVFPMLWLRSRLSISPDQHGLWTAAESALARSVQSEPQSSADREGAPTGLWARLEEL